MGSSRPGPGAHPEEPKERDGVETVVTVTKADAEDMLDLMDALLPALLLLPDRAKEQNKKRGKT